MAIREVLVKNFDRSYPQGVLEKVQTLANTLLKPTFYDLKQLRVFNMDKKRNRFHAGNRDSMTVFLNGTPSTGARMQPRSLQTHPTMFGIEVAHGERLNPMADPCELALTTPEGEIFGVYIKDDHDIYILHDYQQYPEAKQLALIEATFKYIKENILDKKGMENSWIHSADKDSLLRKFKERIESQHRRNLEDDKHRLADFQEKSTRYQRELKSAYDNIARLMKTIDMIESGNSDVQSKLVKEMNDIASHPRVTDLRIEGEFVTVSIKEVIATDKKDRQFYIGNFQVKINTSNSEVKFFGDNPRRSHWTAEDPHPHVNGRNGQACLGNVSATIAELCSQNEMYALVMTCIDFLENANIDDSAGKHVTNWDRVNADGSIPTPQQAQEAVAGRVSCDHCTRILDEGETTVEVYTSYDGDGDVSEPRTWCEPCRNEDATYNGHVDLVLEDEVNADVENWYDDEEEE
jgi:hypothetical protein